MYVYIIRSESNPTEFYIGVSQDPIRRLEEHNSGLSIHTSKFRPWSLQATIWFTNPKKAYPFERWLKSGSGRAFKKRHF